MLGTTVNTVAILVGGLLGTIVLKGKIPERINSSIIKSLSLAVLLIGLKNAWAGEHMMLIILSMVIGTLIGEWMNIEDKMDRFGKYLESTLKGNNDGFARAFVSTSLIYCVGSMAILGALESGLKGRHDILFAKAMLDGVSAVIFSSAMGIGVIFSAVPVFIYQGLIALGAGVMKGLLTDGVVADMSGVGGLLIVAIALNMLEIKALRVGNMLPALFIPLIYGLIKMIIVF